MHLESYLSLQRRVDALLRGRDPGTAATVVPTCPAWTVRDLAAHLTGLCEDWVDGRLDDYGSDAWTAAQVDRFDGVALDDILDRWAAAAERFAVLEPHPVMGDPANFAFGDAATHEADLRGALGDGRVPDDAVALALKASIARWRQTLGGADVPSLLVDVPGVRTWWIGEPRDEGAVRVVVELYELFRALNGRRSVAQMRSWDWSDDPSPYLAAGLPYPFTPAGVDIVD